MALSWWLDTAEAVDYGEFLAYFKAQGGRLFDSDLDRSALMMRKLANNRTFLTERLNDQLKDIDNFQKANFYTPQVFILDTDENFFVRANVWESPRPVPAEDFFFYETPHDHNFRFLTVGYYGPGYRTRIYSYDPSTIVGYEDEPLLLEFLEETTLPLGKVMFFRQSVDIHTQIPPPSISISVNVLKRPRGQAPDQYLFDVKRGRVLRKLNKLASGVLLRLAAVLGNDDTAGVLAHISETSPCRRTRLQAYETRSRLQGTAVWEQALRDPDPLVLSVAERRLKGPQRERR